MLPKIHNDLEPDLIYEIYNPIYEGLPFLVTGAGYFKARKNYFVERDTLNMYLILLTLDGTGCITHRNKELELTSGQMAIINGGIYHKYFTKSPPSFWNFKWIRFVGKGIEIYENYINKQGFHILNVNTAHFEHYFDSVIKCLRGKDEIKDIILCHLLNELLTEVCLEKRALLSSKNEYDRIEHIRKIIEKNYDQRISINDLSKMCYITPYTLIRKFKKAYGLTPYSYLLKIRINQAVNLLESTFESISTISEKVGFLNENNFIKLFKKHIGQSPMQYRKRHL